MSKLEKKCTECRGYGIFGDFADVCDECKGSGYVITKTGRNLIIFLKRHGIK